MDLHKLKNQRPYLGTPKIFLLIYWWVLNSALFNGSQYIKQVHSNSLGKCYPYSISAHVACGLLIIFLYHWTGTLSVTSQCFIIPCCCDQSHCLNADKKSLLLDYFLEQRTTFLLFLLENCK